MELIIDANIVKGFFEEEVLGRQPIELTAPPKFIFERLGKTDTAYLDDQGQIQQEWRTVVEPEWFDRWYQQELQRDAIQLVPTDTHTNVLRAIEQKGFPRSRDRWYVRVAKSVQTYFGEAILITEDIDFYDPKHKSKSGDIRMRTILNSGGSVAKHLKRKEQIEVVCVATFQEWL